MVKVNTVAAKHFVHLVLRLRLGEFDRTIEGIIKFCNQRELIAIADRVRKTAFKSLDRLLLTSLPKIDDAIFQTAHAINSLLEKSPIFDRHVRFSTDYEIWSPVVPLRDMHIHLLKIGCSQSSCDLIFVHSVHDKFRAFEKLVSMGYIGQAIKNKFSQSIIVTTRYNSGYPDESEIHTRSLNINSIAAAGHFHWAMKLADILMSKKVYDCVEKKEKTWTYPRILCGIAERSSYANALALLKHMDTTNHKISLMGVEEKTNHLLAETILLLRNRPGFVTALDELMPPKDHLKRNLAINYIEKGDAIKATKLCEKLSEPYRFMLSIELSAYLN